MDSDLMIKLYGHKLGNSQGRDDYGQQCDESQDKNTREPVAITIATIGGKENKNQYRFPILLTLVTSTTIPNTTIEHGIIADD